MHYNGIIIKFGKALYISSNSCSRNLYTSSYINYNFRKTYCIFTRFVTAVKSLAFQPQTRKGIKDNEGDRRRSWAPGRQAHLCSRSVAYFFPSFSFSLTLLVHCHTGASRYNAPTDGVVRCVSRLTIYTRYEYANRGILLRARVRMIHVATRSIYTEERLVFTRYIRLLRDDIATRES